MLKNNVSKLILHLACYVDGCWYFLTIVLVNDGLWDWDSATKLKATLLKYDNTDASI